MSNAVALNMEVAHVTPVTNDKCQRMYNLDRHSNTLHHIHINGTTAIHQHGYHAAC